jgi:hypothetical protein
LANWAFLAIGGNLLQLRITLGFWSALSLRRCVEAEQVLLLVLVYPESNPQ